MKQVRSEELDRWERELLADIESLTRKIEPLLAARQELNAKLELLKKLKALEHPPSDVSEPSPVNAVRFNTLQMAAQTALLEHGTPMHVSELRESLKVRGVLIPGRGTDANLIVHLRRAPSVFERKARGTYGLSIWNKKTAKGKII